MPIFWKTNIFESESQTDMFAQPKLMTKYDVTFHVMFSMSIRMQLRTNKLQIFVIGCLMIFDFAFGELVACLHTTEVKIIVCH